MDTTVTESKSQAYHRLEKEGRWTEASAYRTEQQKAFRKIGKTPDEARALSWVDTIAHFPPTEETLEAIRKKDEEKAAKLAAKEKAAEVKEIARRESKFVDPAQVLDGDPDDLESISGAELDELAARTKDKEDDYEGDLRWAYRNMGRRLRPNDDSIPSFGAWSLYDYAKKNRHKFVETVMKHLGSAVIEKRKNRQDDSMDQYEMLAAFEKGMAEIK
jgi:hypothetical protein